MCSDYSFKCWFPYSDVAAEVEPLEDAAMALNVPPAASTQHSRRQVTWRERFATAFHMDSFTSEGSLHVIQQVCTVCLS